MLFGIFKKPFYKTIQKGGIAISAFYLFHCVRLDSNGPFLRCENTTSMPLEKQLNRLMIQFHLKKREKRIVSFLSGAGFVHKNSINENEL